MLSCAFGATSFFNQDLPCERCPARERKKTGQSVSMEIFNEPLHVWTMTDAVAIPWEGRRACLLTCHDITEYKRKSGEL